MLGIDQIGEMIAANPYLAIVGILMISAMGVPIPEEPVLIAGGLAVGWGQAHLLPAIGACLLGILAGDLFLYTMGRFHAQRFLKLPPFRWLFTPDRQMQIGRLYKKHGGKTVVLGRFLPTVRFGVLVFAGQHRMPWRRFLFLDILAASIYVPIIVLVGYLAAHLLPDPAKATATAQEWVATGSFWFYGAIILAVVGLIAWYCRPQRTRDADVEGSAA